MRALLAESRIALPDGLPPNAAGVIGYMGYDTVRLVEHLPNVQPDALGVPDAILMRPTLMVVFDTVKDEMIVVTPVYPAKTSDGGRGLCGGARAAALGHRRARRADAALGQRAASMPCSCRRRPPTRRRTSTRPWSSGPRTTSPLATSSRSCSRSAFRRLSTLPPFALYRALRRTNPSPFLFHLDFGTFALVGSSPEILVRVRDGEVTIRPLAGTRRRGATSDEDTRLERELLADPKERAEHLMLLDLGRNDVGRVAKIGSVQGDARVSPSSATATSCTFHRPSSARSIRNTTPSTR